MVRSCTLSDIVPYGLEKEQAEGERKETKKENDISLETDLVRV